MDYGGVVGPGVVGGLGVVMDLGEVGAHLRGLGVICMQHFILTYTLHFALFVIFNTCFLFTMNYIKQI